VILQALAAYYQRKVSDPQSDLAPIGWEWKELPFLFVINKEGDLLTIEDTREKKEGERLRAKSFLVIQGEKRSSGIKPNLLWDNVEYVLGANPRGRSDVSKRHKAFKKRISDEFPEGTEPLGVLAVKRFLDKNPLEQINKKFADSELWEEILESNPFITFRLEDGKTETIFDELRGTFPKEESSVDPQNRGVCLVSGKKAQILKLHPAIKGVRGTNTSGASVVSFNLDAFSSYGKKQNFNAPLSNDAVFAYTTGLNYLLRKDSENKVSVGNTTIVFWAEKSKQELFDMEENFPLLINDPPKDDPDRGVRAVKALYQFAASGKMPANSGERFFVLGLAPNAARISVRFWRSGTLKEFSEKMIQHFEDIKIVKGPKEPEFLTLNQLIRSTAVGRKMENALPKLAADVLTSVMDGTPYPKPFMQQCVMRIRAEKYIGRARAAILKGCINRHQRKYGAERREVLSVALDRGNSSTAYRLGRLFAVLERIQEASHPGINATIRDRFYGAASSSPVSVFPRLLKLKNHHLAKLENQGQKVFYEKEIGEIICEINDFPRFLTIDQQALFAVGYYHQRQEFFRKKEEKNK
jgi:CRISPR-associated protein Csd1